MYSKIYKATSKISGKSYIGQTKTSIKKRFYAHKNQSLKQTNNHFHNAIKKYG